MCASIARLTLRDSHHLLFLNLKVRQSGVLRFFAFSSLSPATRMTLVAGWV